MAPRPSVAKSVAPIVAREPNESALTDHVAAQYRRWIYPAPIEDLAAGPHVERQLSDPSLHPQLFWPDRDYPDGLDILVAGCGSNEAASIAFHNPTARIVGIDVSDASLAHEAYLKKKHDLGNLELHQLPLESARKLKRDFDLVISSGVIHHTADPLVSTRALGELLRRDGVFFIMLYARYGRAGVNALQTLFRMLKLKQDETSLALVKDCLQHLPATHLIQPYKKLAADLTYDSGLVDTFLHGREETYTVGDCLNLVARAGLVFQGWALNANYHPESFAPPESPTYQAVNALQPAEMWAASELLSSSNGCHFFMACRPDRSPESYTIDFADPRFGDWVPKRYYNLEVVQPDVANGTPAQLKRGAMMCPVGDAQALMFNPIDGARTIREVLQAAVAAGLNATDDVLDRYSREFFRSMWRLGLITIRLPSR